MCEDFVRGGCIASNSGIQIQRRWEGNAYAQIIRNGKGEVLSLYPLLPNKMSVEMDSNGVLYYVYSRYTDENPNMKKMGDITLRQEDVLHILRLGFDGFIGNLSIAMVRNAVGMPDLKILKYEYFN